MLSISISRFPGVRRPGVAFLPAVFAMAIALPGSCALAQTSFPAKLIRIVVPFAPGGGTDIVARTVGDVMAKDLGQTVINFAGALFENMAKVQMIHAPYRGAGRLRQTNCFLIAGSCNHA
jgi:tripartite-type tricarboxylate transporter receptor subunit TctC